MEVSSRPKYSINPPPTEEEIKNAERIIAEAKKRAKLNRAKSPQQAWEKFDEVRDKIRDYVNNNKDIIDEE